MRQQLVLMCLSIQVGYLVAARGSGGDEDDGETFLFSETSEQFP